MTRSIMARGSSWHGIPLLQIWLNCPGRTLPGQPPRQATSGGLRPKERLVSPHRMPSRMLPPSSSAGCWALEERQLLGTPGFGLWGLGVFGLGLGGKRSNQAEDILG
jgi:hypothetical protein